MVRLRECDGDGNREEVKASAVRIPSASWTVTSQSSISLPFYFSSLAGHTPVVLRRGMHLVCALSQDSGQQKRSLFLERRNSGSTDAHHTTSVQDEASLRLCE
jgi:hypothetical protein